MPFWPFKKQRRRDSALPEKEIAFEPLLESEKAQLDRPPSPPPRKRGLTSSPVPGTTSPVPGTTSPIPIPRRSSKRPSPVPLDEIEQLPESMVDKENVAPGPEPQVTNKSSIESFTALPMSPKLQYSPHLRPIDMERPHIPYNFRASSGSQVQVGLPTDSAATPPKANVLRKKRSSYESTHPQRKRSTRSRKDEQLREEEIRAMSAQSPIPKRPGEGPLRRDSKKMRSGMRGSEVSLPAHEESVHESLPGIVEQRGWEIGAMDLLNPRPAVRLSGVPQYISPSSPRTATPTSPSAVSRSEKRPVSREDAKKRETIGNRADNFDSNDIRTLLERDAKRRELRKKEQQERLDRKLRKREGRNRGDSDARRREAKERRKAEEEARAKDVPPLPPLPTTAHPALHDSADAETMAVGLGIAAGAATEGAVETKAEETHDVSPLEESDQDPFADPVEEQPARISVEQRSYAPSENQMDEDAVVETAQAVTMSQASTPPLSPVHSMRAASSLSRIAVDARRASDIPVPAQVSEARRASQPVPERRQGALASLFRRSAAQPKKGLEAKSPPSEASFSNASRESMRAQPLPAHLVESPSRMPAVRRTSGTPVRTQSKFREDLPEFPVSPPDSRTASPDVTTAAAAAAAARRAQISSQYIDAQRQGSTATSGSEPPPAARYDTPVSPSLRPGTSLASVDSEGAWLASGHMKRQSKQSGLGADTDAQHFDRMSASPETLRGKQRADSSTAPGTSERTSATDFYDAAEELESPEMAADEPSTPTVHGTVRRRPTLVQRDLRVRSREGLVTEYAGGDVPEPTSAGTGRGSLDMDSDPEGPEPELQRATSVRVHARNVSTGSATLLNVLPRSGGKGEDSAPATPISPKI